MCGRHVLRSMLQLFSGATLINLINFPTSFNPRAQPSRIRANQHIRLAAQAPNQKAGLGFTCPPHLYISDDPAHQQNFKMRGKRSKQYRKLIKNLYVREFTLSNVSWDLMLSPLHLVSLLSGFESRIKY